MDGYTDNFQANSSTLRLGSGISNEKSPAYPPNVAHQGPITSQPTGGFHSKCLFIFVCVVC